MTDIHDLRAALDGEAFDPDSPGYDAIRRPANPAYRDVCPRIVVRCASVQDVVVTIDYGRSTGIPVVPRGGGHCFAGRSSTDGIVLDLSELADITVAADGLATIGAGARLAQVYSALHVHGRTVPAGCGATVGIAGLTLGGGIGLLGRTYGLTCDRLAGARVVVADGTVVDCDRDHEPDLFWALRGAGGGQFGVVTSLIFDTVDEPTTTRLEGHWSDLDPEAMVAAWQAWAPEAPDEVTANLTLVAEPGRPVRATLFGASLLGEGPTGHVVEQWCAASGVSSTVKYRGDLPYSRLKSTFDDVAGAEPSTSPVRIRSEFFARPMRRRTITALLDEFRDGSSTARRQLSLTAMAGAYARMPENATAFAHRDSRFLLEHVGNRADAWVDRSWAIAHADGSGRVYPNFPDPALDDSTTAYHAGNHSRLVAVKRAYDPGRLFRFPQSL